MDGRPVSELPPTFEAAPEAEVPAAARLLWRTILSGVSAMAATSTLLSLDEYLHTSYSPDCDFVDGELEERNLGEYTHGKLQARMATWFTNHEREWLVDPITEQRIRVSPIKVRICDVCLLRSDAPREAVTLTPPLACIEILSPEDRLSRVVTVLEDYRLMGVPNIWLIDPIRRGAFLFDATGLRIVVSGRLDIPGTPIHLVLADLFQGLE
jgi:Uma2 family endonuclease